MSKKQLFKFVIPFIILLSFLTYQIQVSSLSKDSLNLMIVAHPDDESIFAGNEILNHSYYIVCITNGKNEARRKEFNTMLDKTNNTGIILSYPDKIDGQRDDWSNVSKDIENDLNLIIANNNWKKIVTHNLQGEYGHIHHKMTNKLVTNIIIKQHKESQLFYFTHYFKAKDESGHIKTLDNKQSKAKAQLLTLYASQQKTISKLQHILDYEDFIPYQK